MVIPGNVNFNNPEAVFASNARAIQVALQTVVLILNGLSKPG